MKNQDLLNKINNLGQFDQAIGTAASYVGVLGGRYFILNSDQDKQTVSLNQIVKKFSELTNSPNTENNELTGGLLKKIKELDKEADEKLNGFRFINYLIKKMGTIAKSWLGNLGYDRNAELEAIRTKLPQKEEKKEVEIKKDINESVLEIDKKPVNPHHKAILDIVIDTFSKKNNWPFMNKKTGDSETFILEILPPDSLEKRAIITYKTKDSDKLNGCIEGIKENDILKIEAMDSFLVEGILNYTALMATLVGLMIECAKRYDCKAIEVKTHIGFFYHDIFNFIALDNKNQAIIDEYRKSKTDRYAKNSDIKNELGELPDIIIMESKEDRLDLLKSSLNKSIPWSQF
jgi:hypothetical protein